LFRNWLIYKLYRYVRESIEIFFDWVLDLLIRPRQYVIFYYYLFFKLRTSKLRSVDTIDKPRVIFGPCPIINNKYWANALKQAGYVADSITLQIPSINSSDDFDLIVGKLFPIIGEPDPLKETWQKLKVFEFVLQRYDIFVMAFRFNYLEDLPFHGKEARLLEKFGKKVMIIPYGSDYYKYSKIIDQSLKHNLMINMPAEVFNEKAITKKVNYWTVNADFMLMGVMVDDAARWDSLPVSPLCIDVDQWKRDIELKNADGVNEAVTIVHAPNHRGFKGTEFIVQAVMELKEEGLKIDFILLEKIPNKVVRSTFTEKADILVEQLIFTGYGLNGVEGMASGLAVLANWEHKEISTLFRRYSYLNECPMVSTSPETVKVNLRKLITNPDLRRVLGKAGRAYVEKYHSYQGFSALFGEIERKIWYKDAKCDPMNFFNPTNENSYNHKFPIIRHPLQQNRIPD
jgi:glycosyltransferase involved in cell wall biosynthesis